MAFDSHSNGPAPRRTPHDTLPEAPRPRPELWNALRADGIQWEGQVLLVGAGLDIPALLVLTESRFALLSEGEIVLEVPRTWLRPEPKLLAENGVQVAMTPQGGSGRADETDSLTVRVRSGRGAAAKLVSTITGRLVSPREERGTRTSGPDTGWSTSVGASAPLALPPLPDFDDEPTPAAARSWPPVEQHAVPPATPGRRNGAFATTSTTWPAARPAADGGSRATHAVSTDEPAAVVVEPRSRSNRAVVWGLRTLILAMLIGTGLYFGRDSLPANLTIPLPAAVEERFGLGEAEQTPDVSQLPASNQQAGTGNVETPEATKADSDGTSGPQNSDLVGTSSSEDGQGGDNGSEITPVNPGIGEYAEPTQEPQTQEPAATTPPEVTEPEIVPTDEPVVPTDEPVPTQEPAESSTDETPDTLAPGDGGNTVPDVTSEVVPTEEAAVPTDEPVVPTEEPVVPTEEPATEAPATEEPVTEEPATEAPPTEAPATEAPVTEEPTTEAPATEAPVTETPATTEEPATEAPVTEAPATEEPAATEAATLESQPPSVDPGSTPGQSLASGTFRYAITGIDQGETIAELPDLAATGTGEWVVLSMYGQNWSDTEQVFDMSQFHLLADGTEVMLDVGNGWIGGLLGYTPAYGNTDAILWAADEGHPFALTFLVPAGTETLTLVAGDQSIDLSSALTDPAPLSQDAATVEQPEYIEATVVEVIDAETIVIEQDGIQQTVRYVGIDVPTGDDCYAAEATEANRELVEGKTVRLERQATDVDARGNWVRDVWTPAEDGRYFLVSESLVSQGAATAGISEPNTRYAGWLLGSESAAQAEGLGLWGACGEDGGSALPDTEAQAIIPSNARVTNSRHRRR